MKIRRKISTSVTKLPKGGDYSISFMLLNLSVSKIVLSQNGFFVEKFWLMFSCQCFFLSLKIDLCYVHYEKDFVLCSSHITSSEILIFLHL